MSRRWYLICIAVLLLGLTLNQPLLLIMALLSALILFTINIWTKYCLHNLNFRREFSEKRVLFGEEITLSHVIENAKLLPLPWLEVEDSVPGVLRVKGRQTLVSRASNQATLESLFSLRWYERITRTYTATCNARGVHTFGPTRIHSGDLFGFSECAATLENREYVLVYPMVVPLTSFHLPARHPFGERPTLQRLLEDPLNTIGVRDYVYGDSLRRVNWKATARTLQLQSKIYESTTTYTMVIFLNVVTQLDAYFGVHPELQELAICAAASVGNWALDEGYAVGLYANSSMYMPEIGIKMLDAQEENSSGSGESLETRLAEQIRHRRIRLSPTSNTAQRQRLMEMLARIQTYFGTAIEDLITTERTHLPAGATLVVITSTVSEPLLDALAHLKQLGHSVTLLMVGDQPGATRLAGINVYHLGGEKTWEELRARYNTSEDAEATKEQPETAWSQVAGFHL